MDGSQPQGLPSSADQEYGREAARLGHLIMIQEDLPKQIADAKAKLLILLEAAKKEAEGKPAGIQTPKRTSPSRSPRQRASAKKEAEAKPAGTQAP